jgi:predicted alpha-1,2-mannosidase
MFGGDEVTRESLAAMIVWVFAVGCSGAPRSAPEVTQPSSYVRPTIGSGGVGFAHGSNSPAAQAPNGLVKVGPDTNGPYGTALFLHYSGYWFGDDHVRGFSHLRLQGAGSTDYGLLSVMPVERFEPGMSDASTRESPFQKASEVASPGYYAVTLDRGAIRAELTATTRAAHHRYSFARAAASGDVIIDLAHTLDQGEVLDAQIQLLPAERRFEGSVRVVGRMSRRFGGFTIYFAGRSKAAWTASSTWNGDALASGETSAQGRKIGAVLTFATQDGAPVELQVAFSFVSAAQAAKNLAVEMPVFDFDATRGRTAAVWDALLGRIKVSGGSESERTRFYTALYQAFLMPSIQSDVDGQYRGFDGAVHTATGFRYMSDLSMWDTYRTTHPLYALVAPEVARDAVHSLIAMAEQSGEFPKWPLATGDSGSMIGAPAEIVIADAYLRGVRDFPVQDVYRRMRAAALDPTPPAAGRGGRENFETYARLGYVTAEQSGSVSRTGEYAWADAALANFAEAVGERNDAEALRERARGYRALFDPATGFMRAKTAEGAFVEPFDPLSMSAREYVEANAWQSTWLGVHDMQGFVALFGGAEGFTRKLGDFFEQAKVEWDARDPNDVLDTILPAPYYWHGNEPDIHAPYLFALAGRPDLTQRWVRWILDTHYPPSPEGLAGNDDGGTLSSWYVFSALGFYPIAGSDRFVIGAPMFPKVRIASGSGEFVVEGRGASPKHIFVRSLSLDGAPVTTPELRHDQLRPGAVLVFTLSDSATTWGRP